MRRDFDFVAMSDYQADMRETAEQAAGIISAQRARIIDLERMLGEVVLSAGGSIKVRDECWATLARPILEYWRDEADRTIELKARR